jgi:acetyl-CoA synthetase
VLIRVTALNGHADFVNSYDLSSLRVLGTVGEPINPEAWVWYNDVVGKGQCAIVDTYWQVWAGHGHGQGQAPGPVTCMLLVRAELPRTVNPFLCRSF